MARVQRKFLRKKEVFNYLDTGRICENKSQH